MRARDPIRLAPYDPAWAALFAQRATALRAALGPVTVRIDHTGSTAVPSLLTMPVIDIQISVPDLRAAERYALPLAGLGHVAWPDALGHTRRYVREPPSQFPLDPQVGPVLYEKPIPSFPT